MGERLHWARANEDGDIELPAVLKGFQATLAVFLVPFSEQEPQPHTPNASCAAGDCIRQERELRLKVRPDGQLVALMPDRFAGRKVVIRAEW